MLTFNESQPLLISYNQILLKNMEHIKNLCVTLRVTLRGALLTFSVLFQF
jgi:hypothetical protein